MASIDFGSFVFKNKKIIKDDEHTEYGHAVLGDGPIRMIMNKYSFRIIDLEDPNNKDLDIFKDSQYKMNPVNYDMNGTYFATFVYKNYYFIFEYFYIIDRTICFGTMMNVEIDEKWQGIVGVGIGNSFIHDENSSNLSCKAIHTLLNKETIDFKLKRNFMNFDNIYDLKRSNSFIEFQKNIDISAEIYNEIFNQKWFYEVFWTDWYTLKTIEFTLNIDFHKEIVNYILKRKKSDIIKEPNLVPFSDIINFYETDDLKEQQNIIEKNSDKIDSDIVFRYDISDYMLYPIDFIYALREFTTDCRKINIRNMFENKYYVFCHNVISNLNLDNVIGNKISDLINK